MEYQYLFETKKEDLEPILQNEIEKDSNCSFLCPECASFNLFNIGINQDGNIVYCCEDCGCTMTADEIFCGY